MTASFSKSSLLSRQVRSQLTEGSGIRKIDFSQIVETVKKDGFIRRLLKGGRSLIGFAARVLFGAFDFSSAVDWLVERGYELVQFDWNQSDEELQQQQKQAIDALFGVWGGTVGGAVGWVSSIGLGYGITMALPVIGSARLAKLIAASATDEAAAAILGQLQSAIRVTTGTLARNAVISSYIGIRSFIRDTDPKYSKWGRKGGPRWTIAEAFERTVKRIPSKRVQAFVNGATDGFIDSFIEGSYVFAAELDNYIQSEQYPGQNALGAIRTVDLYPDRRSDERIRLRGPESLIRQQVVEELTSHRRLADKDVGFIIGEESRAARTTAPDRRVLRIVYKTRSKPPWGSTAEGYKRLSLKIPDCKNTSWEELKRIMRPYTWGRYYHTIPLDNGRKVMSHGASPAAAKSNAERLLQLTTAKPLSNRVSGEHQDQLPQRKKQAVQMYPVHAILEVKIPDTSPNPSYVDPEGQKYKIERTQFDLWPAAKPDNVPVRL